MAASKDIIELAPDQHIETCASIALSHDRKVKFKIDGTQYVLTPEEGTDVTMARNLLSLEGKRVLDKASIDTQLTVSFGLSALIKGGDIDSEMIDKVDEEEHKELKKELKKAEKELSDSKKKIAAIEKHNNKISEKAENQIKELQNRIEELQKENSTLKK